jgi:cytochrome c
MGKRNHKKTGQTYSVALWITAAAVCFCLAGCGGYSNESLYPDEVGTVYVEMFENESFNRGAEYELTDALAKRIEAQTPYKIVSNRDRADTVLSGHIVAVDKSVLTVERQTGRALEKDVELRAVVSWKNLKTGKLLIDNKTVDAMASYSEWQKQGTTYASSLAANKLARKIVELMEKEW